MLRRAALVGVVTVLGVGGPATPSFAETGGSAHYCDSLLPGCSFFLVQTPLSGTPIVTEGFCIYPGLIPTVTDACSYAEVDSPAV